MSVDSFWISLKNDFTKITNKDLGILYIFKISCLCEAALSALKSIKSKNLVTLVMSIMRCMRVYHLPSYSKTMNYISPILPINEILSKYMYY